MGAVFFRGPRRAGPRNVLVDMRIIEHEDRVTHGNGHAACVHSETILHLHTERVNEQKQTDAQCVYVAGAVEQSFRASRVATPAPSATSVV